MLRLAEELGLFQTEEFAADVSYERKILPEALHFASDELVEKYINILRFAYRGRKIRIEKLEKILADLDSKDDITSEKSRKSYRKKLNMWLAFRDEARDIKRYKFIDDFDETLDRLEDLRVIDIDNTLKTTTVKIPGSVTLNRIEHILELYGQYIPVFLSETTKNPFSTLTEILQTQRRSEKILRPYDAVDTPDWAFYVPEYFNDALDMKLVSRKKNLVEYTVWTQGINFSFDAGDMLYRDQYSHKEGTPALQIISAKKAQGIKAEKLNKGVDSEETTEVYFDADNFGDYYPGEVIYRDFEAGDIKTMTQMDFVKMLIGINSNGKR